MQMVVYSTVMEESTFASDVQWAECRLTNLCLHLLSAYTLKILLFKEELISDSEVVPMRTHKISFGAKLTLVLLNLDIPCLHKQCRSRSVGF